MARRKKGAALNRAEMKLDKNTPFSIVEAYKALRTNLLFALAATGGKTVVVSSSSPGEGKSTTSANLAITLAQTSARVLLIDADLRKPTQHSIFGVENSHGLSKFLVGMESLSESLKSGVESRLDLLTSGPTPPNPSELLGSKNMNILLKKLEEHYDYIIIDSPPVNVVTDAVVLSANTAGILLVAKHNTTSYDSIKRALDAVKFAKANVLGVAISQYTDANRGSYNNYYYKKYGRYAELPEEMTKAHDRKTDTRSEVPSSDEDAPFDSAYIEERANFGRNLKA